MKRFLRKRARREQPRFEKLEAVQARSYRSRQGGFVQLRFGKDMFVSLHPGSVELYEHWHSLIGTYQWIIGGWMQSPSGPERYRTWRFQDASLHP